MRDPLRIVHRWALSSQTEPPPFVRAAMAQLQRRERARTHDPAPHRYKELTAQLLAMQDRAEAYERRRQLEDRLATYVRDQVMPVAGFDGELHKIVTRMHNCRRCGTFGWRPLEDSLVVAWDEKCGLVRLCPDEARHETERLADRYVPELLELKKKGYSLYYCVLTTPNVPAGELGKEKRRQFKRFYALLRRRHRRHGCACGTDPCPHKGKPLLPIAGALASQEDPLGARGDWNVHLNVIIATRAWLDWKALRAAWHWDLHIEKLRGGERELRRTFHELIKYAGAPVSSKSHDKSASDNNTALDAQGQEPTGAAWDKGTYRLADGRPTAPPMLAWPPLRWLEWWRAQGPRFRRTRTYGCLYNTPEPERPKLDQNVEWLGTIRRTGHGYAIVSPLSSIPGDKSTTARGPPAPYRMKPYVESGTDAWLRAYSGSAVH